VHFVNTRRRRRGRLTLRTVWVPNVNRDAVTALLLTNCTLHGAGNPATFRTQRQLTFAGVAARPAGAG